MNMDTIKQKLLLPILALCSFLVGFDSIVTIPLIPTMTEDTNIPSDVGGLFVAAYALAYAVSSPFFGAVSDRQGRKKILLFGLLIFALATALTGVAKTFSTLILFRILSGIGAGMIEPGVYAIVGDHYSYDQRGKAIGIVTGALISASIIGVPIGGYIAEWFTWNWTFWLIAFITAAAFIAAWILLPKENIEAQSGEHSTRAILNTFRIAFSNKSVIFALLATLLYYGGLQGMFSNVGIFYDFHFRLTAGQIGLVLMVAGLGSVLGSVIGGKLADRFGKRKMVSFSSTIVAIAVLVISIITESLAAAILVNVLWATMYGIGQSALTALISELSPTVRGTVMALNSSAMYVGSGLFTSMAAVLLYGGSFLWVGVLCSVANIFVFLMVLVIHEQTLKIPKTVD